MGTAGRDTRGADTGLDSAAEGTGAGEATVEAGTARTAAACCIARRGIGIKSCRTGVVPLTFALFRGVGMLGSLCFYYFRIFK